MTDNSDDGSAGYDEQEGGHPEACPICGRINFRIPDDHCEHYWGMVYDREMFDCRCAGEFESLWRALDSSYQYTDDGTAHRLIENLRRERLDRIAQALIDGDNLWWLDELEHKSFIDAEASPASGTGWNLYQAEDGWFDGIMRDLREAVSIAVSTTTQS